MLLQMKELPLSAGKVSFVDDDVFEWASKLRWTAQKRKYGWHVARYEGKCYVYLHRLITGAVRGQEVDHKNGDGLDNRRENLRLTDKSGNGQGFRTLRKNKTSQFRGVYRPNNPAMHLNPWVAKLQCRGIIYDMGVFPTEEQAARAYDAAAKQHFGEFAQLNFPNE